MLVTIEHEGKTYEVECDGHDNILDAALDAGIENLSYDCKMGVCMTCPSRVTAGKVDQQEGGSSSMVFAFALSAGMNALLLLQMFLYRPKKAKGTVMKGGVRKSTRTPKKKQY